MIRRVAGKDFWLTERPSARTIRHQLSNGQIVTIRFMRGRIKEAGGRVCYVWNVSVYIGDIKAANTWHKRAGRVKREKQTGECGLEGLMVAKEYILLFGNLFCGMRDEMQIRWSDEKRRAAYKWLLRYPGFVEYNSDCIAFRNPEMYEWIPTKGAEN